MTTREVHDRHLSQELDGDPDAVPSDYAPDAIESLIATINNKKEST